MKHDSPSPIEPILFGGFEPATRALRLTVEASSLMEARNRMAAVASLVDISSVEKFAVLVLERPSRTVPLFMDGYFQATRMGMTGVSSTSASGLDL
jgi:hypothetical protein